MSLVTVDPPSRPAPARRPVPDGTQARGFALFVGLDADDAAGALRLRGVVDRLRTVLAEIAPDCEAHASVVVAPVGAGGRSVDVVRRTVTDGVAGPSPVTGPALPGRGLLVDLTRRRVLVDGEPAALTYLELGLLAHLVRCEGRAVPRDELVREVWAEHHDDAPHQRTVDVHVRRLRVKLGRFEDVIRTVRGVGYRVDRHADVTVVA